MTDRFCRFRYRLRFYVFRRAGYRKALSADALGTGIGLSVSQPDLRIATVIAAATIVPTFFIDRTISSVLVELTAIIVYAVLGKIYINPDILSWGSESLEY